ncbi:hypothetical protein FQN54_001654 [Arachnomyces sp. PD_36]|nr:hypothetical protein FQN54_001654 [Arachnomyces sp. PD_36]
MSEQSESERIPIAANVLGTIGTVFWCIQLVPQIWHNWRNKKTDGLPLIMMFLWGACAVPFGAYMIIQRVNIPLQIQPQIFGVLSLVSWGQILYYNHGYSRLKVILTATGTMVLFGGIEALLILTIRIPYNKGITWPALVVGIVASISLLAGLVPPYFELWKRDGRVIGINWVFLGMDALGAFFSTMALAAQGTFDILGGVIYIMVILMEVGIFGSHVIWRFRYRKLRQEAKESGKSIDEILEERDNRDTPTQGENTVIDDLESQTPVRGSKADSYH